MKKLMVSIVSMVMMVGVLTGCDFKQAVKDEEKQQVNVDDRMKSLEKAQKVEILSADVDGVQHTITEKEDIEDFMEKQKMDQWEYGARLPKGAKKQNEYIYYQEDTVKSGEKRADNPELHEVARMITYQDTPYVTLKVPLLTITSKVPDDVAEYLNENLIK